MDLTTIRRAQHGEQDAHRRLFSLLECYVRAGIRRQLGRRFQADHEDIAQEIHLKIFRSLGRFDPERGARFTTWAYTFIRNHCIDVLRRRRPRTVSLTTAGSDGSPWSSNLPQGSATPLEQLENLELGEQIHEALEGLSQKQRTAFVLREQAGLGHEAIAALVGTPEGTVKSRIHRAKATMRESLRKFAEDSGWMPDKDRPPEATQDRTIAGHTKSVAAAEHDCRTG